jgi:hypothetical protein
MDVVLMFLVFGEPKGGVSAEENEKQLGGPTEGAVAPRVSRKHDSL